MTIYELNEFVFLCKKAGFDTVGEVYEYMQMRGINHKQLFNELNKKLFPLWRAV